MQILSRIRAALGFSTPNLHTVNLPGTGLPPGTVLPVAVPAPPSASVAAVRLIAARPTRIVATPGQHDIFRLFEQQLKLDFDLDSKLALASTPDAHRQIRATFAQFRSSKLKGRTLGDIARTPFALKPRAATVDENFEATDEQGVPQPRPVDPIADMDAAIKTLQQTLEYLKKQDGITDADADDDEAQARTALRAGRKVEARRHFVDALDKLTAKVVARKNTSSLRAEKPSRSRAHRLTASGFSEMPAVRALNSALGRGGALSIVDRASLALAPVAGRIPTPPAILTPAAPSGSRERILAIKAEREAINSEYRKTGIYTPAAQARDAKLNRELKAELRKFNVR
jgi:hypothetical protein